MRSTVDPLEHQTDRNLALEPVRVAEAAALAASRWIFATQIWAEA